MCNVEMELDNSLIGKVYLYWVRIVLTPTRRKKRLVGDK